MGAARQQLMLEQQLAARRAKKLRKVEQDNAKVAAGCPPSCDTVRMSCFVPLTKFALDAIAGPAATMLDFGSKPTLKLRYWVPGRNKSC